MKTIKMRKADWQKWDAALRSGEYKQGRNYLEKDGAFCCLGVLQHCLTGKTQTNELDEKGAICLNPSVTWLNEHHISLNNTGAISGFGARSPLLNFGHAKIVACAANDQGISFEKIADAIKEAVEFTDEGEEK